MSELFEKFEVNRAPRWKVLTKLVGASVVLHLVMLWMVIYVPAFRDTLNIASIIASTKFVDKAYNRTEITDDVQLVQLSEKFRYPEGYFTPDGKVAAEAPQAAGYGFDVKQFAPTIISQAGSSKEVKPAASPSPSPEASASPVASPSAVVAAETGNPANPNPSPSPLTAEEGQKQLEKTAEQNAIELPTEGEINKKPLKDLAAHMNDLKNEGKLDLDKPFEITIEAKLDEQGKLTEARVAKKEGDEILQDLFKQMIGALNDSGLLIFLKPINQDNPGAIVRITIKQGQNDMLAIVESETSSPGSAEKLAKTFNGLLSAGAWARSGKDEAELMKNSVAMADGKKVVVNFSMPRQSVVEMLQKQLKPGV